MRWPAAAFPRGVLSLFQSGADDSAPGGSRLRSLLRPLATSASGRPGSAAALLLARVYRRKASGALTEPYLEYARSDRTRSRMNRMRRGRVRLAATSPRGDHFDLDRLFDELNGNTLRGSCSARISDGARGAGGGNSAVTIRAESDSAESPMIARRSGVRSGICLVSRDAAREAPDSPLGVQHGISFAGISRGREALWRNSNARGRILDRLAR